MAKPSKMRSGTQVGSVKAFQVINAFEDEGLSAQAEKPKTLKLAFCRVAGMPPICWKHPVHPYLNPSGRVVKIAVSVTFRYPL